MVEVRDTGTYRGHAEIRGLFTDAARPSAPSCEPTRIWHHTSTLVIDLEGDNAARGRCYFHVLTREGSDHWGRYADRYVCEGGRWLFAERRIRVDGAVPKGWGARRLKRRSE